MHATTNQQINEINQLFHKPVNKTNNQSLKNKKIKREKKRQKKRRRVTASVLK